MRYECREKGFHVHFLEFWFYSIDDDDDDGIFIF